ncbi:MAG: CRTAC1 family protein [Chryseolinea sp.]
MKSKLLLVIASITMTMSLVDTSGQSMFKDVSDSAGIVHEFVVYEGMFGGGASVIDFDRDGWEDVFITGGTADDVLYHNNRNGTFTNVYEKSGLLVSKQFITQGVASADVNRDGWPDLFITTINYRDSIRPIPRAPNLLFLNRGDGTFKDVTKEYGLIDMISFSQGVSFGDFNADGYPDAYVGNYFLSYEGELSQINDATIVNANQTTQGYLLKNINGHSFDDVYADYGLHHRGFGFGAVFTDFDNDQDVDLFVNHDFGYKAPSNVLLENDYPSKEFKDVSKVYGMDLKMNAMGTAIGDYNNDGLMDYYVTNIRFNQFMVNQGQGKPFMEMSRPLGIGMISISWGTNFADFDNDGDLDLFVANGDLNPNNTPLVDFYFEYDSGKFNERAMARGLNDYGIGRGSITFDMDNDGDLDLLVVNQRSTQQYPAKSTTRLYRNDSPVGNNWLKVRLVGTASDLQGLGARVDVVVGKLRLTREIDGGSSHLSQNSPIAHFGIHTATKIDSVIVRWIGGKTQYITNQNPNMMITVTESRSIRNNNRVIILLSIVLPLIGVVLFRYRGIFTGIKRA